MSKRIAAGLFIALCTPTLFACGGGGSSNGGSVSVTPTPSPSASPSPSPSPSPAGPPPPANVQVAGLSVPGELYGVASCTKGTTNFANGRLAGLNGKGGGFTDTQFGAKVTQVYDFITDINGFGGPSFPANTARGGEAFAIYTANGEEFQISSPRTKLSYATYGLVTYGNVCFWAAMQRGGSPPPSPRTQFTGFVDGLSQIGDDNDRLYGSSVAMTYTGTPAKYELTLDLKSVENAFEEPFGQAQTSIGKATASIVYSPSTGSFNEAALTGPSGFTGKIRGFNWGEAAVLIFQLTNSAGDEIFGVMAADAAGI